MIYYGCRFHSFEYALKYILIVLKVLDKSPAYNWNLLVVNTFD